jgi:hypothetical protein
MAAARNDLTPADASVTDGAASESATARIGADMLAAAGEVNRYHAQRLAEYRLVRWPDLDEPASAHEDAERA